MKSYYQVSGKGLRPKLIYLLGFFSTMPIVGLHFANRDISFFRIVYFLAIVWMTIDCVQQGKVIFSKHRKWMDIWLLEASVACLFGFVFLNNSAHEWAMNARSYIPKLLMLLAFSILWGTNTKWNQYSDRLIQGLLAGCIINCIWAIIDAAGYYLLGRSINNTLFAGYIIRNDIRYGMLSLVNGGMIRSGGFNTDPAQIGFLAPIVAGYAIAKKNPIYYLISLGAVVAGASTTALVGTVIVTVIFLFLYKRKREGKLKGKTVILACSVVVIIGSVIFTFREQVGGILSLAYSKFFGRIDELYSGSSGLNDNVRINYIICLPSAIAQVLPFLLFGSGIGTASLGYSRSEYARFLLGNRVNSAYDMENTYIAYLLDTGIIGFALLMIMLAILHRQYRRRCKQNRTDFDIIIYASILSVIVCFMFYHYVLFAPQMLLLTVALVHVDKEEIWEKLKGL